MKAAYVRFAVNALVAELAMTELVALGGCVQMSAVTENPEEAVVEVFQH